MSRPPDHPLAALLPLLPDAELAELAADIGAHGLLEPIVLHEGQILDGRNRWRACEIAGVTPRTVAWEGDAPLSWVVSKNLLRRHLTTGQKALLGAELLPRLAEEARERMAAGGRHKRDEGAPADKGGPAGPRRATADAAGLVGTSDRSVRRAARLLEQAPDLAAEVRQGRLDLSRAERKLAMRLRERHADAIERAPLPHPEGRFAVIVVDPPWQFTARAADPSQRGKTPYPTMTTAEIAALPVADLLWRKHGMVWLWTTNQHLLGGDALEVVRAWGLRPVGLLTWVKDRVGLGDWLRGQTEHCLLAVRGEPVRRTDAPSTLLMAPRGAHSEKPEAFYGIVEAYCPGTKLELFARRTRPGWTSWGAEIQESPAEASTGSKSKESAAVQNAPREGPLGRSCPTCAARVGRRCRSSRGVRLGEFHGARVRAASTPEESHA